MLYSPHLTIIEVHIVEPRASKAQNLSLPTPDRRQLYPNQESQDPITPRSCSPVHLQRCRSHLRCCSTPLGLQSGHPRQCHRMRLDPTSYSPAGHRSAGRSWPPSRSQRRRRSHRRWDSKPWWRSSDCWASCHLGSQRSKSCPGGRRSASRSVARRSPARGRRRRRNLAEHLKMLKGCVKLLVFMALLSHPDRRRRSSTPSRGASEPSALCRRG